MGEMFDWRVSFLIEEWDDELREVQVRAATEEDAIAEAERLRPWEAEASSATRAIRLLHRPRGEPRIVTIEEGGGSNFDPRRTPQVGEHRRLRMKGGVLLGVDPNPPRVPKIEERPPSYVTGRIVDGELKPDQRRFHVARERVPPRRAAATAGRNDPCSCGSGRKSKRCCAAG